uniref:Uncharacterized protein n=1 Tax=Schistosoma mansoni TaxID=6183 RepID=A0AA82N7X5_SCHMA
MCSRFFRWWVIWTTSTWSTTTINNNWILIHVVPHSKKHE